MLKINTTSKYAELKFDDKSDLYPLNEISYTVENESETVSFYNRFYNKIVTEQIANIQVNDVPVTRDNIQNLLSVLFAGYEGGGGSVDLSNYYTKPEVDTKDGLKVDKVSGKGLSTNDYTTEEKIKLESLHNYDDTAVKNDIASNTEAIEAEVIRATAAESVLDAKVDTKVDKVEGKQLSTEDYTTAEKAKLASLSNYDDTAVKTDIASNTAAITAEVTRAKAEESRIETKIPTVQTNYVGNNKNFVYAEGNTGGTKNVISKIDASYWEQGIYLRSYYWGKDDGNHSVSCPIDIVSESKVGLMGTNDKQNLNYLLGYVELVANENKTVNLVDNRMVQHTVITGTTYISLPYIDYSYKYKELHLIFEGVTGSSITFFGNIVWKEKPIEIVEGATYEFIFTWVKSQNKWYAGYIKYE